MEVVTGRKGDVIEDSVGLSFTKGRTVLNRVVNLEL